MTTKKTEIFASIKKNCIEKIKAGISIAKISTQTGITRQTLYNWKNGLHETSKTGGRPSLLSPQQIEEIKNSMMENPYDYGFKSWNQKNLSKYIYQKYNIDIPYKNINRTLR